MTQLTEEQIRKNDSIPTDEILHDMDATLDEIEQYEAELEILMKNPSENKVQIYFRTGKISQRKEFIENLKQILNYRWAQELEKENPFHVPMSEHDADELRNNKPF